MSDHSDFIVYVDESGDHKMDVLDADFPVFALSFCVVRKIEYTQIVVPAVQDFKFKYWGHDLVVLHEHEIRKEKDDFAFLRASAQLRQNFMSDLSELVAKAPFSIIASVIEKEKHKGKYGGNAYDPYVISLHFCLERLFLFLSKNCVANKTIHVVFECRGPKEDRELELAFRRIVAGENNWGWVKADFSKFNFVPKFAKKTTGSTGLQLADLTARPLALKVLRPDQPNRAHDVIEPKLAYFKSFP